MILYDIILYYIVSYHIILYHIILYYIILYYIILYHIILYYLRAAAPAADPGRSGKEAKLAARPFCYVHRCEIYLIGLNFHV